MSLATAPQSAFRTTWAIDPSHTLVEFSARHMMVTTVRGAFGTVTGTLQLDESNPARSSVAVAIDAASLSTRDENRDNHLKSPDFLDVATYPTITFTSTRVEPGAGDELTVYGDLTIRGVTREVALKSHFNGRGANPWGKEIIAYTGETTINRKDFGANWNVALEAGGVLVGEQVRIHLELQAVKGE